MVSRAIVVRNAPTVPYSIPRVTQYPGLVVRRIDHLKQKHESSRMLAQPVGPVVGFFVLKFHVASNQLLHR